MKIDIQDRTGANAYRVLYANVIADGETMSLVTCADDETGVVEYMARDEDGKVIFDPVAQEVVIRTLHACKVSFTYDPPFNEELARKLES